MSEPPREWQIIISAPARRDLRRVGSEVHARLMRAITALAQDPRPHGYRQLEGQTPPRFRVRVGDWRIVYAIEDDRVVVLILEVGPRSTIYRRRR